MYAQATNIVVTDEVLAEYYKTGYLTWSIQLNGVVLSFRTLPDPHIRWLTAYTDKDTITEKQFNVFVLALSLDSLISDYIIEFYRLGDWQHNFQSLTDFFIDLPAGVAKYLSNSVLEATKTVNEQLYNALNSESFIDDRPLLKYYSELSENVAYPSTFHVLVRSKINVNDFKRDYELNWGFVKFLSSMWNPKAIKEIERREKLTNFKEPTEEDYKTFVELLGEDKAKAIFEKMRKKELVFEGDADTELTQSLTESSPETRVAFRYTFDEERKKYIETVTDSRTKKEILYWQYLATTPEDRLLAHDKHMRPIAIKKLKELDATFLKLKSEKENMRITDVSSVIEKMDTKDLLKRPIFNNPTRRKKR